MIEYSDDADEAQAEFEAIEATPETLENPKLEAVAMILGKWLNMDSRKELRYNILGFEDDALKCLAEARRQTGADELAAAVRKLILRFAAENRINNDLEIDEAFEALAAYERIAK